MIDKEEEEEEEDGGERTKKGQGKHGLSLSGLWSVVEGEKGRGVREEEIKSKPKVCR